MAKDKKKDEDVAVEPTQEEKDRVRAIQDQTGPFQEKAHEANNP